MRLRNHKIPVLECVAAWMPCVSLPALEKVELPDHLGKIPKLSSGARADLTHLVNVGGATDMPNSRIRHSYDLLSHA